MRKKFITLMASSLVILLAVLYFGTKVGKKNLPGPNTACLPSNLTGQVITENIAYFEGEQILVPEIAFAQNDVSVLGSTSDERWIEVDISEQKLKAWEGDGLYLESMVSTGLPWWPTPIGEFRIWIKLRATKMEGGEGEYYYYLPNVPYVMYFENENVPGWRGYGLHGTYWHSDFGTQRSHGCVNLPTNIAEQLYYWVSPELRNSKWSVRADNNNLGTRIIIHE